MDETCAVALPTATPTDTPFSFEALYRDARDDLHAYVLSIVRNRAVAEDVTATAFERAYRRRALFRIRRGTPRAWLFGIARNAALDELRRGGRSAQLFAEPADGELPDAQDAAELSVRRTTVAAALESLEGSDRELIALRFFAGLSHGEIARVLGTSESNAGTRLHRALNKLREVCHEDV